MFTTADNVSLRLTRRKGGARGPVLLSHCIGVSSLMYLIDTQPVNLVEFLYGHGFDVWLLDHRLSIEMRASREQSTMDDVATKDYPAAVAKVCELSGQDSVQVVAHGVGSSTFTMAMLAGLQGVRSAVCSQVSTHLVVPKINRLKTTLRMSQLLWMLGIRSMTAYVDQQSPWTSKLYNASLRLYPVAGEERCNNPVCHRISAMYGALYEHDQVGTQTHEALHEMFGIVNLTAFRQLSLIIRRGHLVDANGRESYLPHIERLGIPIAFIHGADNDCVLPESTEITYNLLRERNGQDLYSRLLAPGYGHVDCIFGENASTDIFPFILKHLSQSA
ncbi:MAG: alpha/beta fold hydrolase [Dehalococcoidia bacterium]